MFPTKPPVTVYIFKERADARVQVVKDEKVIYDQQTGIEFDYDLAYAFEAYVIPLRDLLESLGFNVRTSLAIAEYGATYPPIGVGSFNLPPEENEEVNPYLDNYPALSRNFHETITERLNNDPAFAAAWEAESDKYWVERASKAEESGYLGVEESAQELRKMIERFARID